MQKLVEIAKEAALEAGHAVMKLYETTDFETKADGSPVTIADHASNDILIAHLEKTGIPILSEEIDGITAPYPPRLWIIDPIDGTNGFINSDGDFAVMVGLLEHGKPTLGVMYAPAHGALYVGGVDTPAYIEHGDTKTEISFKELQLPIKLVHSKNHYMSYFERVAEKLNAVTVPRGGIGIKVTVLLEGEGDCFFTWAPLGVWDVCAPQAITEAAGGIVSDCFGDPLVYGEQENTLKWGAVFSHKECHRTVVDAVSEHPPTLK